MLKPHYVVKKNTVIGGSVFPIGENSYVKTHKVYVMEEKYHIEGNNVEKVIYIGENKYVYPYDVFKLKDDEELFDDIFEARYCVIKRRLQEGIPLKNYKGSKYYKRYIERLKKDMPEYVI